MGLGTWRWSVAIGVVLLLASGGSAAPAAAQARGVEPERCRAAPELEASAVLRSAMAATGARPAPGRVLHYRSVGRQVMNFQSDRTYPPFFSLMDVTETWYDPVAGAERRARQYLFPRQGPTALPGALTGPTATYTVRDSLMPAAASHAPLAARRMLNPWAVLRDWLATDDVTVEGECRYRDAWRLVLSRTAPAGEPERLFIDADSRFPVKLDRVRGHATWGQRHEEYLYSTWLHVGDGYFPTASFMLVDGATEAERTVGDIALIPRDSAPALALPEDPPIMAGDPFLERWSQPAPEPVRVADGVHVLSQRFYNSAVALVGDTVYLLDAVVNETRARQDSALIAELFPGRRPVAVVVTDLAWPHIGGVRFWVARGATIISHPSSRPFLERIVDRRWSHTPDALERARREGSVPFRFRGIDTPAELAPGLRVFPLGGFSGEGALLVHHEAARFLWAGDWIQQLSRPTLYATEVVRAVRREGIEPTRFAAQHQPLNDWSAVIEANAATLAGPPFSRRDDIDGGRVATGTFRKTLEVERDGARTETGTTTQTVSVVQHRGAPALLSVQRFEAADGRVGVDSALAALPGLEPIEHASHNPARTMRLRFEDGTVRGRVEPASGDPADIHHRMKAAPYDSNVIDLVISALPLEIGYTARLPFYIYERDGLVFYDVRVVDTDRIEVDGRLREVWVVEAARDAATTRYLIDRTSREVLRSVYPTPDGRFIIGR